MHMNCKKLFKPPSIQSGSPATLLLPECVREPDYYFLYYPPVHPKISEFQSLSCPLVICSDKGVFLNNIWYPCDVFCFCQCRLKLQLIPLWCFFAFWNEGTCLPAPFWLLASSSIRWLSETVFIRNGFTAIDLDKEAIIFFCCSERILLLLYENRDVVPTMSKHDFIWKYSMDDIFSFSKSNGKAE